MVSVNYATLPKYCLEDFTLMDTLKSIIRMKDIPEPVILKALLSSGEYDLKHKYISRTILLFNIELKQTYFVFSFLKANNWFEKCGEISYKNGMFHYRCDIKSENNGVYAFLYFIRSEQDSFDVKHEINTYLDNVKFPAVPPIWMLEYKTFTNILKERNLIYGVLSNTIYQNTN